jgi:hypothetical protein
MVGARYADAHHPDRPARRLRRGGGGQAPKPASDPNRLICKNSDEPGSRIQRRKVCATASEWAERKRIEMQNLLERQRNEVKQGG